MKGIFHEGPTMEPLFQMYLTVRRLAGGVGRAHMAKCGAMHTLVVCDSSHD